MQLNYTIYSKIDGKFEEMLFWDLSERPHPYNLSQMNQFTELTTYFHRMDPNVHPIGGNSKTIGMKWNRTRFDPDETLQLAKGIKGNYSFEGTFLKCQDVSIIDWEAKVLESLAEKVTAKFVGRRNKVLSRGKEGAFIYGI
jgi:hypothetical protein